MVQEETARLPDDADVHRFSRQIEPASVLNPNKAVMTLDASGKILTVNDMATIFLGEDLMRERTSILDLLPYSTDVASVKENLNNGAFYKGTTLSDTNKEPDLKVAAEEDVLGEEGIVVFSGNVVTVDTDMGEMPVSLWMKELPLNNEEEEAKWIAVLEPISITVSTVKINKEGQLLSVDEKFGVIFGSEAVIDNDNLYKYISLSKPCDEITEENYVDQPCTVTTKDGETFPLCVSIRPRMEEEPSDEQFYDVRIKLFSNISGLMVVNEKCEIQQYNHNFTRLLLGYGSKELEGQNINQIFPDFEELSCNNLMKKELFKSEKDSTGSRDYTYTNSGVNDIPYIDESLKENEGDHFDGYVHQVKKRIERAENERNANSEGSTINTPNLGFVISDSSQFTFGSSNFQKSTNNFTVSNPSFNQTVSKEETGTPPAIGSPTQNSNFSPYAMRDITNSMNVLNLTEQPDQSRFPLNLGLVTSTPAVCKQNENLTIQDGSYFCTAKHKDGSSIPVLYQIRRMFLNGKDQYCIWIVWEPIESTCDESQQRDDSVSSVTPTNKSLGTSVLKDSSQNVSDDASPFEIKKSPYNVYKTRDEDSLDFDSDEEESTHSMTRTDGSSANDYSLTQSVSEFKPRSLSENDILITSKGGRSGKNLPFEDPEWIMTKGEYNDHYTVLKQIGKGAFGFVRLSYKQDGGLLVVTKFIKKSQVYHDSWIDDPLTGKKVCLEVDLLMKLDHPNIVKGITFYENDKYFQLVMEKWGSGMDLFEFIERDPALDEPLISHIFRQIVSPLVYLKSLNITHRDIKDENIIINERFHIKLIDFGSAAYLKEGKKFSQFAGTIEYCSPEVLKGRKYTGPELEVWSLGITLYTIICGENPFNTISEVLNSPFVISHNYTEDLFSLLSGMLKKDPKERLNLDEVSDHSWTNQNVDLDLYSFEDIVPCDIDELSPPKFVADCSGREDSLSTTSSSFVYEDRQSFSAKEEGIKSPNSAKALANSSVEIARCDDNAECSSRTSSSRSASYKSSVTIDSSVFLGSRNNVRKDTCSSSASDATDASFEIHSQTLSVTSNESKASNLCVPSKDGSRERTWTASSTSSRSSTSSDTSVASVYSDDSTSSDSEEEDDIEELSSSSSSSSSSSTSSSSSSSSSSNFISQETVSADSGSDDNTLENTYTNILALEKEEEE